MAPMGTLPADKEGFINQRTVDFHMERAKDEVYLIGDSCRAVRCDGGIPAEGRDRRQI